MKARILTSADIDNVLDSYTKFRPPIYRTPFQLLHGLQKEFNTTILPFFVHLDRRNTTALYALDQFAKGSVKTDKKTIKAELRRFRKAEATAKEVMAESKAIQRQLDSLPNDSLDRD